MKGKYFLDTNIFVYSFDSSSAKKQKISKQLILDALESGHGIVSYQVVQEFFNVALKKFASPMSDKDAKLYMHNIFEPILEIFPDLKLYADAIELKHETKFSFYDCLIIASALKADCKILYSEDLQAGRNIRGLKIENPFL